jgi:gamma-glutamylcyclotransferase (GGCT)/AIG2-like uncharacterized protein YtfP
LSPEEKERVRVFVYGTLKAGFSLFYNEELSANRLAGERAEIAGELYDLGPFPALRLSGRGMVSGEVHIFERPGETLAILDEMEGYYGPGEDNHYVRKKVEATLADGSRVACYTYEYARPLPEDARIEDGVWPPDRGFKES